MMPYTRTWRFRTGLEPGMPRHTGQTWVFGASASVVGQEQNILDLVGS